MADLNGEPGDTVEVDYSVTNSGELEGTQDIVLVADDGTRTNVDRIVGITLEPAGSNTGTLIWEQAPGGEYTLCVESEDSVDCISVALSDIPDSLVDNFEAGPDGIYTSGQTLADYYTGDTESWSRGASNAVEGSQALQKTTSNLSQIYSLPGDGLNNYPNEGDTIGWLTHYTGDVGPGPLVAAGSDVDGINGYLYAAGSSLQIWEIDGGSYSQLNSSSWSPTADTWYWCEGRVPSSGDSTLSFEVYNLNTTDLTRGSSVASVSTTDPTYVGRGIGWANVLSGGTGTAADWLRVL